LPFKEISRIYHIVVTALMGRSTAISHNSKFMNYVLFRCLLITGCLAGLPLHAADQEFAISTNFPGGNAVVDINQGKSIHISPDLRTTTRPWFYWYFEVKSERPGRVELSLPAGKVGLRGPAVSQDDGKTWRWLGADLVTYANFKDKAPGSEQRDTFYFDFPSANQKVRFSVGFPYVQSNLDEFLLTNGKNPHLSQSILATTLSGRSVELLQIGQPGPATVGMLVAARSHACEALASYVLEGFLQEAMSDSPSGIDFRKKYVLYAVPILDKDGVQAGDQGKNRAPHDHNRDYGTANLYPEIKALQALGIEKAIKVAIDFHCPALKGDIHAAYHWLGLKVPLISENADELSAWLGEERPMQANAPINLLTPPPASPKLENIPFSWYFSSLPGVLLSITLESPYALMEDVDGAREYGRSLLRALIRTKLVTAIDEDRGTADHAAFLTFQKQLTSLTAKPDEAKVIADSVLDDPKASPIYRAQANLGMAAVHLAKKQYKEALLRVEAVKEEQQATNSQKVAAAIAVVSITVRNSNSSPSEIDKALSDFEKLPYSADTQRHNVYQDIVAYYESKGDYVKALDLSKKALESCPPRQKTTALLQTARLLDKTGHKNEAISIRQDVVAILRPELLPSPKGRGIFQGIKAGELFDALNGIPNATLAEKREAAHVIINYPTLPSGLKQKAEDWMRQNPL